MVFPAGSRAPLTLRVCTVDAARAAPGVNVTVRVVALYAVVPDTAVPFAVTLSAALPDWIGSLSVALIVVVVGTLVALPAGLVLVTVGGTVSLAVVSKTTSTQ